MASHGHDRRAVRAGLTLLMASLGAVPSLGWAQSSVTLYGIIDLNLRVDKGSSGNEKQVGTGLSRGSRFGFIVREDLGDGWRALGILEAGFNADDGQLLANGAPSPGFGRQAFLGLGRDGMGMVSLGRQYTPIFAMSAGALDPFGANYIGNIGATQGLEGGLVARASNAITYTYNFANATDSPTPRDRLSFAASWAPGEAANGSRAGDQFGLSLGYGTAKWFVGYAANTVRGSAAASPPSTAPRQTSQVLGGTYRFDAAMLFASVFKTRNNADTTRIDRGSYALGARVPVSSGQFILQYQASEDDTAAARDLSAIGLAYEHFLSKRTVAYVNYGRNMNSATSRAALYQAPASVIVTPGYDPQAIAVGMRHSF